MVGEKMRAGLSAGGASAAPVRAASTRDSPTARSHRSAGSRPLSCQACRASSIGAIGASADSAKAPQCMVAIRCTPRSAQPRTASAGFMCSGFMNQRGRKAPTGIRARSMAGLRAPISARYGP